ncbi:MAG: hypothetical protein NC924_10090 [Candidatus Omnitrophica bacterium]|nr:hypothetical protein [Candidatus Omnitrophota bacterium]
MPTSVWRGIEHFVDVVVGSNAQSLLDIGVGKGKWGFLFREYTDVWRGRWQREQWRAVVDGIEIFTSYIQEHQRAVYSDIFFGDARSIVPHLFAYDIVMAGDVIEHFSKEQGIALIEQRKEKTRKYLITIIPLGDGWMRAVRTENEYELHRAKWELDDVRRLGFQFYTIYPAHDELRRIGFFVYYARPQHCLGKLQPLAAVPDLAAPGHEPVAAALAEAYI